MPFNPDMQWTQQTKPDHTKINDLREILLNLEQPVHILKNGDEYAVVLGSMQNANCEKWELSISLPPLPIENLGDSSFKTFYNTRYSYIAGAMAHAISGEDLVIAMGKAGYLASYGAGGVSPARVEKAIQTIQEALPEGPYAFNLIFNPNEPALERKVSELYVQHAVRTIEASAFLDITLPLVYYRVSGLAQDSDGKIHTGHRVIAKISRKEVASRFMQPAPQDIIDTLLKDHKITPQQAQLALHVPLADDITVEADSGGHTDNRPLVCLLPTLIALRDKIQDQYQYDQHIRIGAAGGISTPISALAAFSMGAAYIVTGSINQSCIEAAASEHTRNLLSQADMADVIMAPAADMFEMGVKVQVLKRGTMFAMRAQKLYEIYKEYNAIADIPPQERQRIEKTIFMTSLDDIWDQTEQFFSQRDPVQLARARQDEHYKMALVFRWYLGLSSHWSNRGEKGREMDYQIWCGPAMGAFNDWVQDTYLSHPHNRRVADVAYQILTGAALQSRVNLLKLYLQDLPLERINYHPESPKS